MNKTTFKLTQANAAAVLKYSKIVSADPDEFLNKLVYDFCTRASKDNSDSLDAISFLSSFGFKTVEAAERYLVWVTDLTAQEAAKMKAPHNLVIKIKEDSDGLFRVEGMWRCRGMNFPI